MSPLFDLEEDRIRREVVGRRARRVLVQLPEGLRSEALRLASIIEGAGALAIISADPCYGACDLAITEANLLSVDLLIHLGHSEHGLSGRQYGIPTIYIETRALADVRGTIKKALEHLRGWSRIGLATTVHHAHAIDEAKKLLKEAGKEVYVGSEPGLKYPGQVLGCDYRNCKAVADNVEAFLFIGSGLFHAVGVFLATMKPTIAADPFTGNVSRVDGLGRLIIGRRWADICEASRAERWGVIVGLKSGQFNLDAALRLKRDLEISGRRAVLLAMREVTPEIIKGFPEIEAYANTACPRISLYETRIFEKPVLTPREVYVVLGKISWDEHLRLGLI